MLINATKYGQLGNRLQLFAHYLAFAIENDQEIVNLGFDEYANLFENTRKDIYCRYPPKNSFLKFNFLRKILYLASRLIIRTGLAEKIGFKVIHAYPYSKSNMEYRLDDPQFINSINNKNILANGYYFVDYNNLLKHADKIREYFKPSAVHASRINSLVNHARESCDILVGIHIRHGDYKQYRGGKYYYGVAGFLRVMGRTEMLFPGKKVGFLVCSDESHNRDDFSAFTVTYGTRHIIEDMYSLALCDYIAGTPSTYSIWASFHGDVPIYRIKDVGKEFTLEDFIPYKEIVITHMKTAPQFPCLSHNLVEDDCMRRYSRQMESS